MDDSPAHVGPFTVQLPIEVDEADWSAVVMVGECVSVWLGRRGGESGRRLVVVEVLDVIDLSGERSRNHNTISSREYYFLYANYIGK